MSADLLPTEIPGPHYQGDVLDLIDEEFDLVIAHPPCTYLANSGVQHLYDKKGRKDKSRWQDMKEAAEFFESFTKFNTHLLAIENPIQHKYAKELHGQGQQDQIIQPYMFGHTEQKATCLWLYGLPLLKETNNVREEMMDLPVQERQRLHYLGPSEDRWKLRSMTYPGIAEAMAEQWGRSAIKR